MRKLSFTAFIIMAQGISGFAVASDGHDHLTPLPDEVKQHILGKVPRWRGSAKTFITTQMMKHYGVKKP
jgi:hypothetical protein